VKFQFDISDSIKKARKYINKHVDGVTIEIPFITFSVKPTDIEKKIARELLIRLTDKRVLNSKECCDNCIDNALASLQEVRKILIDKQVELSAYHDGGLYLLIELMTEVTRQFLTFQETLKAHGRPPFSPAFKDFHIDHQTRDAYMELLEQLRFHMHSCLTQIAKIAEMRTPKVESYLKANDTWLLSLYLKPDNLIEKKA
jgi:hypothetical protein